MEREEGNLRKKEIIDVEIRILKLVNHANVIKLEAVYETSTQYLLVLQLITGGELFEQIVEITHYSEADASRIVRQILEGVDHMHKNLIVHRDLKPENLLLSSKEDPNAKVLITDFGLSAIMVSAEERLKRAVGTPGYLAPEVLFTLDTDEGYGLEVDAWGIGVIMYILLCGYPPFYGEDDDAVYDKICDCDYSFQEEYWGNISDQAKDLIRRFLTLDPTQRITPAQALEHPWIQSCAYTVPLPDTTIASIKSFNARRRFKAAITGVLAMQKFLQGMPMITTSKHRASHLNLLDLAKQEAAKKAAQQ